MINLLRKFIMKTLGYFILTLLVVLPLLILLNLDLNVVIQASIIMTYALLLNDFFSKPNQTSKE